MKLCKENFVRSAVWVGTLITVVGTVALIQQAEEREMDRLFRRVTFSRESSNQIYGGFLVMSNEPNAPRVQFSPPVESNSLASPSDSLLQKP